MQYMLLIYEDERIWETEGSGPTFDETVAKHMALAEELGAQLISGAGLKDAQPPPPLASARVPLPSMTVHTQRQRNSLAATISST